MWTLSLSAGPCAHTVLWPLHTMWVRVRKNQGEGFQARRRSSGVQGLSTSHTRTHIHTYTCAPIQLTQYACFIYVHMCAQLTYVLMHIYMHTHTQTHICTHAHECTHVHSPHTYLPTYLHTSTQPHGGLFPHIDLLLANPAQPHVPPTVQHSPVCPPQSSMYQCKRFLNGRKQNIFSNPFLKSPHGQLDQS